MRNLKIAFLVFYDNLFRNTILLICCFLFASNLYSVLSTTKSQRDTIRFTKNPAVEQMLFVSIDSYSKEELNNFTETLETIPYIEISRYTEQKMGYDSNAMVSFTIERWGEGLKFDNQISLSQGRMPSGNNEILLCENLSPYYKLNQTITLEISNYCFEQNDVADVTIVGFYSPDAVVPASFLSFDNTFPDASSLYSDCYNYMYAYVTGLTDTSGNEIIFDYDPDFFYYANIANIKSGESPEVVKERLMADLSKYSNSLTIATATEILENYQFGTHDVFLRKISTIAAYMTTTLITFFSAIFLSLLKKTREMTIYYMYGMTWTEILVMNSLVLFPGIIIGNIVGCVISHNNSLIMLPYAHLNFGYLLISILINLLTLATILIPLIIYFSKINPIESLTRNPQ